MTTGAPGGLTVLVLAGQRSGIVDPLAAEAGVRFKALAPVSGRPMIAHVLDAAAACPAVREIVVSINEPEALSAVPEAANLAAEGRLRAVPARGNLADSVVSALEGARFPALITTADNVLLCPAAIAEFDAAARGADVAVALARREDVLDAHPDGQRKFYRCGDGAFSNCNAYWISRREALAPAELFRTGGQFVKYPLRAVGVLGLAGVVAIVRFRFGLGTLAGAFRALSRRFRMEIRPVVLKDGAVAIDVDHARSRGVAEQVLAARGARRLAAAG